MKHSAPRIMLALISPLFVVSCLIPAVTQTAIKIAAKPIANFDPKDPSHTRFGELEFRRGLVLTSPNALFGGISAIHMESDGVRFLALSDRGMWFRGRMIYANQRPVGIDQAVMAPMRDSNGNQADRLDAESLAKDEGIVYVGLERQNSILRFNYGRYGLQAGAERIEIPAGIKDLPANKGIEAMVFLPEGPPLGGTLVAISECGLDEAGNLKAFLIGGPMPGTFSIKRTQEFDISDAALLPEGDLLILERKFFEMEGTFIRIRRIRQNDIKPGSIVDGTILFEADAREEIDNMEGLSVHRTREGETIVTMISDDNYSTDQRTVLLQFALVGK